MLKSDNKLTKRLSVLPWRQLSLAMDIADLSSALGRNGCVSVQISSISWQPYNTVAFQLDEFHLGQSVLQISYEFQA